MANIDSELEDDRFNRHFKSIEQELKILSIKELKNPFSSFSSSNIHQPIGEDELFNLDLPLNSGKSLIEKELEELTEILIVDDTNFNLEVL